MLRSLTRGTHFFTRGESDLRTTKALVLSVVVCAFGAPALAQTTTQPTPSAQKSWSDKKGFLDVGGGFQASSHTLETNATPTIYGETASIDTTQKIGSSGLFEISGGYKVWRNVAIAVGYTHA